MRLVAEYRCSKDGLNLESHALAEQLVAGHRSALVMIGRGGMGKSAALNEVARVADAHGLPVRWARGQRLNRDDAFAAVEDHLDDELVERLIVEATRGDLRAARR